jgi:hypothetical protein
MVDGVDTVKGAGVLTSVIGDNLNWGNRGTEGGGSTTDILTVCTVMSAQQTDAVLGKMPHRDMPPENPADRVAGTLYLPVRAEVAPVITAPALISDPSRRMVHPDLASAAERAATTESLKGDTAKLQERLHSTLSTHAFANGMYLDHGDDRNTSELFGSPVGLSWRIRHSRHEPLLLSQQIETPIIPEDATTAEAMQALIEHAEHVADMTGQPVILTVDVGEFANVAKQLYERESEKKGAFVVWIFPPRNNDDWGNCKTSRRLWISGHASVRECVLLGYRCKEGIGREDVQKCLPGTAHALRGHDCEPDASVPQQRGLVGRRSERMGRVSRGF